MASNVLALIAWARSSPHRKFWSVLAVIVVTWVVFVLAFNLRIRGLGAAQLWYDESGTLVMSRLPLPQMLAATAGDTHPPLYFLVTWALAHLGLQTEAWLRLPSVVFSMAALWAARAVGERLGLSRGAVAAAVLWLMVSSFQLYYAREARPYALLQLLVLGVLWAALARRWWWFGLLLTATLYTHNYGLFYATAIVPWAWWRERRARVLLAGAVALAVWSPWAVVLAGQMRTVAGGYWIQPITAGAVIEALWLLLWSSHMPHALLPLAIMATAGALLYALWRTATARERPALELAYLCLAPLALAVAASLLWRPVLLWRGLIGTAPLWVLLIAWALARLPRARQFYALALLAPLAVGGVVGEYHPDAKGIARPAIARLRAAWQPGDVLYHAGDGSILVWLAYAPDLPQAMWPRCTNSIGALSDATLDALGVTIAPLDAVPHQRAWIIYTEHPTMRLCQRAEARALIAGAELVDHVVGDALLLEEVWRIDAPH